MNITINMKFKGWVRLAKELDGTFEFKEFTENPDVVKRWTKDNQRVLIVRKHQLKWLFEQMRE